MQLTETVHLPLGPAAVARMYADPEYAEFRARALGAQKGSAQVTGDPEGAFTVTTELVLPTDEVPDIVRRFVGTTVTVRETQQWQAPAEDGTRAGTIELDVAGTPASMRGTMRLAPAGGSDDAAASATEMTVVGELTAQVPLLGRRLEKAALPYVSQVLAREERAAADYAERSAR